MLDSFISPLVIIGVISFFITVFRITPRQKRESNGPIEAIHTFTIKELNDEQFHNDFSKVPGGKEIGVTNTPSPRDHVVHNRIINGEKDLVLEDLAKIGIKDDPNKKK